MRLFVAETGKYDGEGRLTAALPGVPAAVMVYNAARRVNQLVLDFDPTSPAPAAIAAVQRDVDQVLAWIRACDGVAVVDRSPRGGVHVIVPLAAGEWLRRDHVEPLLRLLKAQLPTLDLAPMLHPKEGCITAPGARCKTGGFRQLVDMTVDDAVGALTKRSAPRLVANLVALIDPQRRLGEAPMAPRLVVQLPTSTQRVTSPSQAPLRDWIPDYLATGAPPALREPNGKEWTPSHARLAVLEHHAARGWTLADVRATQGDSTWAGFWTAYADRRDADKRLGTDWERAFTRAEQRTCCNPQKSSQSGHKLAPKHTGGIRGIRWKLAAARKWILLSGEFQGQQQWTALLAVTALAFGISIGDGQSAAMGGRWLSIAGGLVGEDAVWTVLRKMRSLPGSPVRFLGPWNGREHAGDRYRLVEPRLDGRELQAVEWEAYAARIERIDPVWRLLGFSTWWVYEILRAIQPTPGEPVEPKHLALAARVSLSTVHRAADSLAEHGLADHGHGWIALTGRSPRRIPELTDLAEELLDERITRHRKQRSDFYGFVDIIDAAFTATELAGYATLADVRADDEAYFDALAPGAVRRGPPTLLDDRAVDEQLDHALALLQDMLGAVVLIE